MSKTKLTKAIREHYLTKRFFKKWYNITLFRWLHAVLTHPKNAEALTKAIRELYLKKKYLKKWRNYKREEEQPPSYEESEMEEHTTEERSLKDLCELSEYARKFFKVKKGDFASKEHTDARFEAMCNLIVKHEGGISDERVLQSMMYQRAIQGAWCIHRDHNSWCRKEDVMMKGTTEDHPFGNGMFFTFYDRNKVAKDQLFFSFRKSNINEIFIINTFGDGDIF
tara:strand:+ start:129 stop:800 length:672 start_codon:yes stop_codon:yes gene_type:complete